MTSRNYCFTSFDIGNCDIHGGFRNGGIRYVVWSIEHCPSTDKMHIQGYCELYSPRRVAGFKKLFGDNSMHVEKRLGTRDEARDYCMKEDTRIEGPFELGEWKTGGQGKRTDLMTVADSIDEKGLYKTIDEHPDMYIKFHNGMEKLALFKSEKRNWKMEVIYICGEPGIGKTRWVYDNYEFDDIYEKPYGKWWDGYQGEPVTLLDDFDGSWFCWSELMKLLDRYPHKVEVKGGYREFISKTIIITSNRPYKEWYTSKRQDIFALERRFTKSIKIL